MPADYLKWLTALAIFVAIVFLLRGQKIFRWKFSSHFLGPLLFLFIALILLPKDVPVKIVQYFAASLLILAVVFILFDFVFSAFSRIKNALFLNNPFSNSLPSFVLELCRAMELLAIRRIGSLIIIERRDNLDNLIGGGIAFDAQVKAEIITALFEKSSIVHDGAMIVRRGRIVRVRAILPLSSKESIPQDIGTRHRSAIGITENTDAIALIVSEERGEMSLASRGILVRTTSRKELLQIIQRLLKNKKIAASNLA